MTEARQVIFLDRDGTINVDQKMVYRIADWQFTPGAVDALKTLQDAGYTLAIITNQSGIGHNLYTESDMHVLHEYMKAELAKAGVTLAAVAYCPHARDAGCSCRKPKTGMAKQIEQKIGAIDYPDSWTIGDKPADVGFGKAAGTKTILLRSRYWAEDALAEPPDFITESLREAADIITQ